MAKEATEEKPTDTPAKKSKRPLAVIIGIVAGLFILQAVGIFIAVKVIGRGPIEAAGIEIEDTKQSEQAQEPENKETGELEIARLECPHTSTGRLYVIRMTVYASVPKSLLGGPKEGEGGHKAGEASAPTAVSAELAGHMATIKDRMRTIVAGADPGTLCLVRSEKPDYGLSTLRRQFKGVLEDVLGAGKIKDVLISDYMPTPVE